MGRVVLPSPEEPRALRATTRALLEDDPEAGLQLLAAGEWIAGPLWDNWRATLEAHGLDYAGFLQIVVGYRNELRLWVMGERTWEHCAEGLAGRVTRRLPPEHTCCLGDATAARPS
jgi:hypothetical protein